MPVQPKVLIAADDSSTRLMLGQTFGRLGHEVRVTPSLITLQRWVSDGDGQLVITDASGTDNVFAIIEDMRKRRPELPIIVIGVNNNLMTAITAAKLRVADYLPSPINPDELVLAARRAMTRTIDPEAMRAQARALRDEGIPIVGRSEAMQAVYRSFARLIGVDLTVLVVGETGSGKSAVAKAMHDLGPRRERPFVTCNLASVPLDCFDGEFLGNGQGAPGKLAEAEGGTLFLDEIGDLALEAQAKLVRILDGAEHGPDGRPGTRRPRVRIIAATSRDLPRLVHEGLFRSDLYFRLNIASVQLPPLRDRLGDVPELARTFLLRAHREGFPLKGIDTAAIDRLKAYGWPGNVRELENTIRRICILYDHDVITAHIVDREIPDGDQGPGKAQANADRSSLIEKYLSDYFAPQNGRPIDDNLFERILLDVQRPLIRRALRDGHGNQSRAADILGINRNTLRRKIQDLGLEPHAPGERRRNTRAADRLAFASRAGYRVDRGVAADEAR